VTGCHKKVALDLLCDQQWRDRVLSKMFGIQKESRKMLKTLWNDECGVILSAELVLIATILVLGMIVGLVELQSSIVSELSDLSSAFGNLDQSYQVSGFASYKDDCDTKARTYGASYSDQADACDCDSNLSIVCSDSGEK
jgi:Flp pilus assembly pilin Flp